MIKGFRGRFILILFISVFSVLLVLPTFGEKTLKLTVVDGEIERAKKELASRFSDESYTYDYDGNTIYMKGYSLTHAVMNEVKMKFDYVSEADFVPHWAEKYLLASKVKLGLDLQGGMNLVIQADYKKMEEKIGRKLDEEDKKRITSQAIEKINSRINLFGVSESVVRPKGTDAIELQLPGVSDPQTVKNTIGNTGQVEYHIVDDEWSAKVGDYYKANKVDLPNDRFKLRDISKEIAEEIALPENLEIYYHYNRQEDGKLYPAYPVALHKTISMSGDDIKNATIGQDQFQKPAVSFTLTEKGAEKFARVTGENKGKRLAILIDEQVRSAPQINDRIVGGQAQITGDFTYEECEVLANIIEEGALPVELMFVEERTVGPSLGQDSINAGFKAIIIGLAGIMIFMLIYYKLSGFVANLCLILNMLFLMAIFSWIKATLTLPGIAGLILTVGMSVDANVIIYERIKEEIKRGKSPRVAVSNGFGRAFWTIFDANLTTLIAAFILSQVGTGPIKGFAVTLAFGIVCSMFASLYVSRFIFEFITAKTDIKKLSI
ncbi:MAG: protein translocase subunit SecD [Spirochaetes bacterium]|jgi:protein-export membrane protein SecD|nr:protein translocase subunit SecD [Spirochaetota bacterium]